MSLSALTVCLGLDFWFGCSTDFVSLHADNNRIIAHVASNEMLNSGECFDFICQKVLL